jgi:hypothetical protein
MTVTNIAGNGNGAYQYSTDNGASFTASGGSSGVIGQRAAYIASVSKWYVSLSNGQLAVSTDGINFPTFVGFGASSLYTKVVEGPTGTFLVSGSNGDGGISTDSGATWSACNIPGFTVVNSIEYGQGLFVAVGNNGSTPVIRSSPDGTTWTSHTVPAANGLLYSLVFSGGRFYAGGGNAAADGVAVAVSANGTSWSNAFTTTSGDRIYRMTAGLGFFVGGTTDGSTVTSPDGNNWTVRAPQHSATFVFDLSYDAVSARFFAGIDSSPHLVTSTDGITFTNSDDPGYAVRSIASSNEATSGPSGSGVMILVRL